VHQKFSREAGMHYLVELKIGSCSRSQH